MALPRAIEDCEWFGSGMGIEDVEDKTLALGVVDVGVQSNCREVSDRSETG